MNRNNFKPKIIPLLLFSSVTLPLPLGKGSKGMAEAVSFTPRQVGWPSCGRRGAGVPVVCRVSKKSSSLIDAAEIEAEI